MSVWSSAFGHPIGWRGPSPHRYAGKLRGGSRGLVVHIASGFFEGTISWQLNTATTDPTSSHWVVGRDGSIAQMLDTDDASWAQAVGNTTWHSIENEGFGVDDQLHATHPGWEQLTDAQIGANAALLARGHLELGWPLEIATDPAGTGLGHHSMGAPAWGHGSCPGAPIIGQKLAIVQRAQALVYGQGGDMSNSIFQVPLAFAFDERGDGLPDGKQYVLTLPVDNSHGQDISVACDLGSAVLRVATRRDGADWQVKLVRIDSTQGRVNVAGIDLIPGGGVLSIGRCRASATDTDPHTPVGVVVNTHA